MSGCECYCAPVDPQTRGLMGNLYSRRGWYCSLGYKGARWPGERSVEMASLRLMALLALAATAACGVRGGYSFVRPECDSDLCTFESDKRDGAPSTGEEASVFEPRRPWSLSVAARSFFEDGGLPLCACRVQVFPRRVVIFRHCDFRLVSPFRRE